MPRLRIPHKLRDHDEGQFNRHFLDFTAHYLFDPSACNIRSSHEKGRVENAAKYIKNNFLAGRTFSSLADCNQPAAL